jgi:hypothetical protein
MTSTQCALVATVPRARIPSKDPEAMGQGLNPPAPDLAEEAAELTPAELFWVTKNGIRMTGMPAWGATHDDESIWPVVAFMTRLPDLDASAYQELLASAEGQGHHAEDAAGEEHSHEETRNMFTKRPQNPRRRPRTITARTSTNR